MYTEASNIHARHEQDVHYMGHAHRTEQLVSLTISWHAATSFHPTCRKLPPSHTTIIMMVVSLGFFRLGRLHGLSPPDVPQRLS